MTAILSLLVKSSLVLLVAAAVDLSLRRRGSAAGRHLLWTCALLSVLLLPVATWSLPRWDVAITVAPAAAPADVPQAEASGPSIVDDAAPLPPAPPAAMTASAAQPARPFPWLTAAFAVYISGVLLLLARMIAERFALRRLMRGAETVDTEDWKALAAECLRATGLERPVRLLRARAASTPMAVGLWRAVILLPVAADDWSTDRRRAVLLHEMAHVARRDCLSQTMAAGVCALYWIHPGVWWAARRLRIERELACDDRVLAAGTPARDYAGHLLEIAYAVGRRRTPSLAVAMARPAQLEGRMLAVLDSRRKRTAPRLAGRFAMGAATAALLMPLASLDAHVAAPAAIPRPVTIGNVVDVTSSGSIAAQTAEQTPADESTSGSWELRQSERDGDVHLRMTRDQSSHGFSIALSKFEGLTPAQLSGSGGPVRFLLRRDAGTFTFEGTTRSGVGGGTYSFAANPAFAAELDKRGFGRPTVAQQYELASGDIGAAFLDELSAQQYTRPDLTQLVRAGRHG
ncbi:MAG TPA: M56 family metallopeptidase, partial [Gemmatimonadaceae bacterium]